MEKVPCEGSVRILRADSMNKRLWGPTLGPAPLGATVPPLSPPLSHRSPLARQGTRHQSREAVLEDLGRVSRVLLRATEGAFRRRRAEGASHDAGGRFLGLGTHPMARGKL